MKKLLAVAVLASTVSAPAMANTDADASSWIGNLNIGVHASTLGPGFSVGYEFSEAFDVKGEFNGYDYDYDGTEDGIDYNFDLELKNQGLLVNWHPFEGGLRLTAGAYHNGNKIGGAASYSGTDSLEIGGSTYTGSDIASMNTSVEFSSIAPYLGVGYGAELGGVELGIDVGVMYQGSPEVSLNVTPNGALPAPVQAAILADAEQERSNLEKELNDLKYYPVAKISLVYHF